MHHSGVAVNCEGISFLECHVILFLCGLKLAKVSKGKSAEFDFIQLLNAFVSCSFYCNLWSSRRVCKTVEMKQPHQFWTHYYLGDSFVRLWTRVVPYVTVA